MISQEITNYVNQARQSGMSNEGIKQNLLNAGWPEADIDQALGGGPSMGGSPQSQEADNKVLMSVLSYFGPLVLIPYFSEEAKRDEFTKFHIKQGLVMFVVEILWFVISIPLSFLGVLLTLGTFGISALAIIGIINAATGKMKPVPIFGQFANKFKV